MKRLHRESDAMMADAIKFSAPQPSGLTKARVDAMAADIAGQLGYQPGADLDPIVDKLGGRIERRPIYEISDPSSGSIRVCGEDDFVITLALHTGPTRDRFTIAHELGHYVLHFLWPRHEKKDVGPIEATRYGGGQAEWEANWFAAGFLMPAPAFRQAFRELDGDLFEVADRFKVSHEAARVRAETLRLGA